MAIIDWEAFWNFCSVDIHWIIFLMKLSENGTENVAKVKTFLWLRRDYKLAANTVYPSVFEERRRTFYKSCREKCFLFADESETN